MQLYYLVKVETPNENAREHKFAISTTAVLVFKLSP